MEIDMTFARIANEHSKKVRKEREKAKRNRQIIALVGDMMATVVLFASFIGLYFIGCMF